MKPTLRTLLEAIGAQEDWPGSQPTDYQRWVALAQVLHEMALQLGMSMDREIDDGD